MNEQLETSTINLIYWRIIPLFFAMMFFNYLDRINIGFAGLRMNHDLGFGPAIFGFGASIFFLGYMVLEIPSNLMALGRRARLAGAHPDHLGRGGNRDGVRVGRLELLCAAVRSRR